jgi:hypothetical protein
MRRALRKREDWVEVRCYKKLQNIAGYTSSPGIKYMNNTTGLESTLNR